MYIKLSQKQMEKPQQENNQNLWIMEILRIQFPITNLDFLEYRLERVKIAAQKNITVFWNMELSKNIPRK